MMGSLYHSLRELSRKTDAFCGITEGESDAYLFRKFHPFANWNHCGLFMLLYHKLQYMSSDLWIISECFWNIISIITTVSQEKTDHNRQNDRHIWGGTLCRVVGKIFTNEKTVAGKGDTVLPINYPEKQSTALFTAKAIRK
jgi:hypothetical protein